MTAPSLLHKPTLCSALLSWWDLPPLASSQPLMSWTASPPAPQRPWLWSFWAHDWRSWEFKTRRMVLEHERCPSGVGLWIQCSLLETEQIPLLRSKGIKLFDLCRCHSSTTLTPRSLRPWHAPASEGGNILLSFLYGHVFCWVQIAPTRGRQSLSCVRNHSRPPASKYLPAQGAGASCLCFTCCLHQ